MMMGSIMMKNMTKMVNNTVKTHRVNLKRERYNKLMLITSETSQNSSQP